MSNKIVDISKLNKGIEEAKSDDLVKESPKAIDPKEVKEEIKVDPEDMKEDNIEELPRKEDGSLDIDKIAIGKDEKGRYIVEDHILDKYYKELPEGTSNKSRTAMAYNKGKIKCLTSNDTEIQRKGANTLNARLAQRRTFAEAIDDMLRSKASKKDIEEFNLPAGATNLEMIIASAARQAGRGNVRAMDFIRDTIGQKPSENINAAITGLTEEDKQMLANIQERLSRKD